jgi:hypothetical protein
MKHKCSQYSFNRSTEFVMKFNKINKINRRKNKYEPNICRQNYFLNIFSENELRTSSDEMSKVK